MHRTSTLPQTTKKNKRASTELNAGYNTYEEKKANQRTNECCGSFEIKWFEFVI